MEKLLEVEYNEGSTGSNLLLDLSLEYLKQNGTLRCGAILYFLDVWYREHWDK